MEQLKEHTRVKRETLKNNTKQAKEGLMNSRLSNKNEIKGELMSGKMMFETLSSAWQAEKCVLTALHRCGTSPSSWTARSATR